MQKLQESLRKACKIPHPPPFGGSCTGWAVVIVESAYSI